MVLRSSSATDLRLNDPCLGGSVPARRLAARRTLQRSLSVTGPMPGSLLPSAWKTARRVVAYRTLHRPTMYASRTTTRHPESREDFIMAHPQDSKGRSRIPRPLWNRTNLDRKLFRQSQTFNRIGTPRFRLHMGRTTRRSLQHTQASPYHRASPTNHRLFIRTTRGTLRGLRELQSAEEFVDLYHDFVLFAEGRCEG